jgi:hypothetical protein
MYTLLRLPLILLELALRGGAGALKDIVRLLGGGEGDDLARPSGPAPQRPDPAAARRDAEVFAAQEARVRRARRGSAPAPAPAPAPEPAPAPAPEAELLGEEPAHVSRGDTAVASFGPADDPSPALRVQAPWDGYDGQPAAEIAKRVRAADEATKAVVLLYEQGHKARASIVRAAGGQSGVR